MKHEIAFRIILNSPPDGVEMKMQKGRSELVNPVKVTKSAMTFEFALMADISAETPNFLGPFAQGPKYARFVYVNSGQYAGQHITHWARRAKLSLMSISKSDVETLLGKAGARFEATIEGTSRDGGPVCASVKGLEWRIVVK